MDMLKNFSLLGGSLGIASLGAGVFEGMDYETYRVQLITATKDTQKATKLMQDAIQFANKIPFETGQIIEATAKFESMGLSAEKWLGITADMAGATYKDMIQGVEAIIDAVASGEFERLKEFGLSKKTLEDLDVSGKVFNNKGQVISQLGSTELLFGEMEKRYKGGAEALSKTTKGMWSTVTGVFKNSMAKIVGIMDDGTVRSGSLLENFRNMIGNIADKLVQWQQDGTINKISAKFDVLVAKGKIGIAYLINLVQNIKQKFIEWQQDGTIDALKEKLGNIFKKLINFIPKSINFITTFYKSLRWILPIILGISAGVKTWGIISNLTAIGLDLLAKKQAIVNIAAKIFNKAAWSNPWSIVIGVIVLAITWLILNFDKVKEKALQIWEALKVFGTNCKEIFVTIGVGIKDKIISIFAFIGNTCSTIINGVIDIFSFGFDFIVGLIKIHIDTILFTINSILDGFKFVFNGIIDFFTGVFTGNWEQALNGLKNIADGVFTIIKGIFLAPFKAFSTGFNFIIDKINSISINVPEWIPVIGGKTFGFKIPNIPNFATGTSYHRGGLAEINERGRGEIVDLPNGARVIPADKSKQLINKKGDNTINVIVNINNASNVDEIIDTIVYKLKLALANM